MRAGELEPTFVAMVRRLRHSLLALLALALAVTAAGCGGAQGSGTEGGGTERGGTAALPVLDDLTLVADATGRADSARFEMEFELQVPALESSFSFSANGAFDTPAKKAEITMDLGSFAEVMSGLAGSFGGNAPPELMDSSKWKLDLRLDGTVAYMRLPFLASELPSGKSWVRIDLAEAARLQGADFGELQSLAQGGDPRETLDYLRSVSGELSHVGTEEIRGVPTSHYFAVVDWQKALARAAREANQPGLLDQLQGLGGSVQNIPVDVWVDKDNFVRRMTMELSISSPGQQQAGASISMELFDYGEPVSIEAPPAGDVVDSSALTD